MTSTLDQIKKKVRRLTASPSENQLADTDINDYIDTFYEQDLPAHLKLWSLKDNYTFYTEPGEDKYTFDNTSIFNLMPPLYIDGIQCPYYQSQASFYSIYPKQNVENTIGVGDGTVTVSGTIPDAPIIKRSITITALDNNGTQQVAIDYPETTDATKQFRNGKLQSISLLTGTINYDTGVFSVSMPAVIPLTSSVIARSVKYNASRPQSMLYFNNSMILRPVPDSSYRVDVTTYKRPSQLLSTGDYDPSNTPDISQWWQFIAYGVAIKIFEDRQDMESVQNVRPAFEEQKNLVLQRTIVQNSTQQVATIYNTPAVNNNNFLNNWGMF